MMTAERVAEWVAIAVVFGFALVPVIASWVAVRRRNARPLVASGVGRELSRRLSVRVRSPQDPEALYIPGVGFVIGDISCKFNGRSPFIRCAVNPTGPCADCRFYQAVVTGPEELGSEVFRG